MRELARKVLGHLARPITSKIHRFGNAHKGESCYLMGDGISIKWFDLSRFGDKIAIPSNFFMLHSDIKKLNIQYVVLPESFWFYPRQWTTGSPRKNIKNPLQKFYKEEIIRNNPDIFFFLSLTNLLTVWERNVVFSFYKLFDSRLPGSFISNQFNCFSGSLRFSIMLSIYMGFDHAFLVGHDYTHVPSRSLHWYEKGEGVFQAQENYNREFFRVAKEFIDITTITLDGTGDGISAISYKQYTGEQPKYSENTELLGKKALKALSSWPGYDIL